MNKLRVVCLADVEPAWTDGFALDVEEINNWRIEHEQSMPYGKERILFRKQIMLLTREVETLRAQVRKEKREKKLVSE